LAVKADFIANIATATDVVVDARDTSSNDSLRGSWSLSVAGEEPASTARNSYAKMKIAGHQ
jgi:hypothetical protein